MRYFIFFVCSLLTSGISVVFAQGHEELYTINFKNNSSQVDKKYAPLLNKLAKAFSSDSCRMIKIIGYADASGTKQYNDVISEKRANSVYSYLLSQGQIDTNKVYLQWQGESDDIYDLHLPSAHVLQRSVDIWVLFNSKRKSVQIPKK